jgi:hypothetical protein
MGDKTVVAVALPQSEGNSPDRAVLQELLAMTGIAGLTRVECVHRFAGGYSACRVYLAIAEFGASLATQPWILKLGPVGELRSENSGLATAKAHVRAADVAGGVAFADDGSTGLLIVDYAHYEGRAPIDLQAVLDRVEAVEAFTAVVQAVSRWSANSTWKTTNLSYMLKGWTASKLPQLPQAIQESADYPNIVTVRRPTP